MPGAFLTAEWRDLAMLNYEVSPDLLQSRLPRGVELDSWQGRTFVSVVGFMFLRTRLLGVPVPFHRDFEEVNLRFYIRRHVDGELRRGVCFVRELVPRAAIAFVARSVYNEPYLSVPMKHSIAPDRVEYGWRIDGKWNGLRATRSGEPSEALAGSQEEFITEHYWGYCSQSDGGTVEYRVEHPRWRVWQAREVALDCDVARLYGPEFVSVLGAKPVTAFVADGSETLVRSATRI
jgi:uncharacterized protein YqjF (DUF2071 family)